MNAPSVTVQEGTEILGNNSRKIQKAWKELCYGKTETLEDAEEAARWWRYNLGTGLRCCDVRRDGVVVMIRNKGVVCKIMG